MKYLSVKSIGIALVLTLSIQLEGCKNKTKDTNPTYTDTMTTTTTAPVEIESDDALKDGVRDATKDYPGVTATVENGEITLTGTIKRSKLPDLMASLNSLHPKKINNNLTVN